MTRKMLGAMVPRMKMKAPGPRSRQLCRILRKYESPSASYLKSGAVPIVWESARGANVRDADGNIYVDLTGAFCVAGVGHANPKVVAAIKRQAERLLHSQGVLNPSVPRVQLVEKISKLTPKGINKSVLINTGAEAVELALKTVRLYTGKAGIIAFHGAFHGKTYGALAVTSRREYRDRFLPLASGVTHVPYASCYRCAFDKIYPQCGLFCAKYLEYILDDPSTGVADIGAVILEPVQGHDGWIVPPPEFLPAIRRICDRRGILMIVDEIITGFGRTGEWFAVNHANIVPDIMILAKGIAGGFPIAAVAARTRIMEAWPAGLHSSTFLGNPLGCAACLAAIGEIERWQLVKRSKVMGERFKSAWVDMQDRHPLIGDVRGQGMMVGVELVTDRRTRAPASGLTTRLIKMLQSRGIIANQGGKFGNVIKMSPPLVLTEEQMQTALRIMEETLSLLEKTGNSP